MECLWNLAVAFRLGPLTVRWYGVIISLSMALAIILAYKEAQRQHQDADFLLNLVLLLLPAAVIGARLYYVLVNWSYYSQNPGQIVAIWQGGSAIHGGILAAVLVVWLYCRAKKQDFFRWADILIWTVPLAQAIGRWGNWANGEAYGPVLAEGSFWYWMPFKVWAEGAYHHPLFLYESVLDLLIFLALLWMLRRPHRIGYVFGSYLIFYSLIRFFLEYLRSDALMIGPYRAAQLWSAVGVAVGVLVLSLIRKRPVTDVAARPPRPAKPKSKGQGGRAPSGKE